MEKPFILEDTALSLHPDRADFETVGPEWSRHVFPHVFHRLYWVKAGGAVLHWPGGGRTPLRPGWMYLVPAQRPFHGECRGSFSHWFIHFQFSLAGLSPFDLVPWREAVPLDRGNALARLFPHLHRLLPRPGLAQRLEAEAALRRLLVPFFTNRSSRPPPSLAFLQVLRVIQDRLHEDLTVPELARGLPWTLNHFTARFRRAFGVPPVVFLNSKRIERAQELLWNSALRVNEVARSCGFRDALYFSKVFRRMTTFTPTEYRARRGG